MAGVAFSIHAESPRDRAAAAAIDMNNFLFTFNIITPSLQ
ncbi:hypothetical protein MNB_SV-8-1187 [hydrothermal vent metagenome]|uniref:Uncharacterized protein n=1 Tax=hydrothermal vent metagenome TaxID=652676 RepID=A0A1W1B936_9ZZZZ